MAKAIEIRPSQTPAPADLREDRSRKLDAARLDHAEALLDSLRTLQTLSDTHTLEFIRGLLGAGDEVLNQVVSVLTSPQSTRTLRNLLILTEILGTVNPDKLHKIAETVTPLVAEQSTEPPSLVHIGKRLFSKDSRRALGTGVAVLEAIGRSLDTGADIKRSV